MARTLAEVSHDIRRQIGLVIDRAGFIHHVIVGDTREIVIPELSRFRIVPGRLRGLRVVHTHLFGEKLTEDDITDLALLRLDAMAVLHVSEQGLPARIITEHLLPPDGQDLTATFEDTDPYHQSGQFDHFITALDDEISAKTKEAFEVTDGQAAVVVGAFTDKRVAEHHMAEMVELAGSAGITVLDTVVQVRPKIHPKFVIGPGKLKETVIATLRSGADFIIFDNPLSPAQARAISNFTEMKILDRPQLILDIFARRATSNEGKIRVELAQLKHIMPRLSARDDSLSRLTGGIGGRGPGETRLEIDRRRISDRIAFLTRKLKDIEKNRNVQRAKRRRNDLPVVSVIGYTNAGKSTLLNNLTNADVLADNLMFATLDTSAKRIRFPEERDVIINDTVGFIRDLPDDLRGAFKSTLEELADSDLLVHLVDASDPHHAEHVASVRQILRELDLADARQVLVLNKVDRLSEAELAEAVETYPEALLVSALDRKTFRPLLERIRYALFQEGKDAGLTLDHYRQSE